MANIVFTQTDLDNLKEALLTGADEVVIGDRKIRYRSQQHLLQLIKMAQDSINGAIDSNTGMTSSLIQATFKKGQV
jgi:collagenase-like PrtC family protease